MSADSKIDEPVPKLPRGRGMKWSGPQLFRIGITLVTLVGVVVLAKPCADAVSGFVTTMDGSGSAAKTMPTPSNVELQQQYETITPNMTEAEMKALIERSKTRSAGGAGSAAGSGSAVGSGSDAGSGSAVGSGSATP